MKFWIIFNIYGICFSMAMQESQEYTKITFEDDEKFFIVGTRIVICG
jgi:hypothetical protein